MIEIKLTVKELPGSVVDIHLESPPAMSATQAEAWTAGVLMDVIKAASAKLLEKAGDGHMMESTAIRCPKCNALNQRVRGKHLYNCTACGQTFGA